MPNFAPFALVEAFCSAIAGSGNPAGVVLLDRWVHDDEMQQIAKTVNQAETAFLGPGEHHRQIRWFTPGVEVDLCGHATVATAAFLDQLSPIVQLLEFESRSGVLLVSKQDNLFSLDFPSRPPEPFQLAFVEGIVPHAVSVHRNQDDWMVVMPDQKSIEQFEPDLNLIANMGQRGLALTAPGDETDFCYRFFAPQSGVPEDHATGSAQTYLVPFWANILGINKLTSIQLSPRGGIFESELLGDRVKISGEARVLIQGQIQLTDN